MFLAFVLGSSDSKSAGGDIKGVVGVDVRFKLVKKIVKSLVLSLRSRLFRFEVCWWQPLPMSLGAVFAVVIIV